MAPKISSKISAQSDYVEKVLEGLIIQAKNITFKHGTDSVEKENILRSLRRMLFKKIRNDPMDELILNNIISGAKEFVKNSRDDI
ncbi:MAG: hypothetical protein ACRENF_08165 [Thermodesulfobacteriota bacterium]